MEKINNMHKEMGNFRKDGTARNENPILDMKNASSMFISRLNQLRESLNLKICQ